MLAVYLNIIISRACYLLQIRVHADSMYRLSGNQHSDSWVMLLDWEATGDTFTQVGNVIDTVLTMNVDRY